MIDIKKEPLLKSTNNIKISNQNLNMAENKKEIEKKINAKLKEIYSGDKKNPRSLSWNIVKDAIKYSIYYTKKELKNQGSLSKQKEILKILDEMIKEDKKFLKKDIDAVNFDICKGHLLTLEELKKRIEQK